MITNRLCSQYLNNICKAYLHPLKSNWALFVHQRQFKFKSNRPSRYGNRGSDRQDSRNFHAYTHQIKSEEQGVINKSLAHLIEQTNQTQEQIKLFLAENQMVAKINNLLTDFDQLELSPEAQKALKEFGFTAPSPIQQITIPLVLEGKDLINIAQTGSGKTLAFILPGIAHLENQFQSTGARILVLAPTRELANQIHASYEKFTKCVCLYGGSSKYNQQSKLSQGANVIIATPGRLMDLMKDGLDLKSITQVVLDEADRMLDMGFEEDVKFIMENVRSDRQTLFFSATWPQEVRRFANALCQNDPELIQIGNGGLSLNSNINQSIELVTRYNKDQKFFQIIENDAQQKKILIFCERKMDTEDLQAKLNQMGLVASYLHGDLSQLERDLTMRDFRSGKIQCLIATNLASRGIDVKDVDLVINYDFPNSIEDYIHRIGRTGRAGKSGQAISLINGKYLTGKLKKQMIQILEKCNQAVPIEFRQLQVKFQ